MNVHKLVRYIIDEYQELHIEHVEGGLAIRSDVIEKIKEIVNEE